MKWAILVLTINGNYAPWATFNDSIDAASYKTQLFAYNRRNPLPIKERGWIIPTNWQEFNRNVIIKKEE